MKKKLIRAGNCLLALFTFICVFASQSFANFEDNFQENITPFDYLKTQEEFIETMESQLLTDASNWVQEKIVNLSLQKSAPGTAYTVAFMIEHGCKIAVMGDIHGNYHSLKKNLYGLHNYHCGDETDLLRQPFLDDDFKLAPGCYLFVLGDYVDRILNGIYVLHTLMRLKMANRDQLILLRGNHETNDTLLDFHELYPEHSFLTEWKKNLQENGGWFRLIRAFSLLPQAVFIGTKNADNINDFLMFFHGGIGGSLDPNTQELAFYNPHNLITNTITRSFFRQTEIFKNLSPFCYEYLPGYPLDNGFLWNDFAIEGVLLHNLTASYQTCHTPESIKTYFAKNSDPVFFQYNLKAIVGGHNHCQGGIVQLCPKTSELFSPMPLESKQRYLIEQNSVYNCISCNGEDAYAIIEPDEAGNWFLTPYITPHT